MAIGNVTGGSASIHQEDLPILDDGSVSNAAQGRGSDFTHRFINDGNLNHHHIRKAIMRDVGLTMSVIARETLHVRMHYPSWPADLYRVSRGVALMSAARVITAQDLARCPHLAQGGAYLRPHFGRKSLYGNGAFRLPNGVTRGVVDPEILGIHRACRWWHMAYRKSDTSGTSATFFAC